MEPTSTDGYQSPFQQPLFNITAPSASVDLSGIFTIIFFLIFVGWVIYSATITYHWLRYSHRSWLAIPTLAAYFIVSGFLIFYIAVNVH